MTRAESRRRVSPPFLSSLPTARKRRHQRRGLQPCLARSVGTPSLGFDSLRYASLYSSTCTFLYISLFTSSFPSKSQQEFEWLGSFRASTILWLGRGRGDALASGRRWMLLLKCIHIFLVHLWWHAVIIKIYSHIFLLLMYNCSFM